MIDLEKALSAGADILGINNRDLSTFQVDLNRTKEMVKHIPSGKIIVSESGISTNEDILMLNKIGVNAVLIGETFMKAKDICEKVREVMGR